jgi:hypothetical protein
MVVFLLFATFNLASAQQVGSDVSAYLQDGEFSLALQHANAANDDLQRQQIVDAQSRFGERLAAQKTAALIADDQVRARALAMLQQRSGDDDGQSQSGQAGVPSGGVTQADFDTLIQLIQDTIATTTWNDSGGEGSIRAFPTGVYVDASGVLHKLKSRKGSLLATRKTFFESTETVALKKFSKLRKVSLTRLERAAQLRASQGRDATEAMRNLAGLTSVRFVMIDPETSEVIIAGPAGEWTNDESGKAIRVANGNPVLQLDDFVVCLRNAYSPNKDAGKFGCAIVPRKENLAETVAFLENSKLKGKRWQDKLRQTLGQQDIDVFGIEHGTHAARVLVEADYHMKLVGMGIEPSIPEVRSYLDRVELDANGNPPPMDVVRWWFALNYDQLISNEQRNIFEFRGPGVKVLSETEFINRDGERLHTGKAVGPTAAFAKDFTRNFERLADHYPIYQELRNVFDLAVVANLIHEYDLADKASWRMTYFSNDVNRADGDNLPPRWKCKAERPAKAVDSVINRRVIRERRDGETFLHTLVGVSGGVSFDASEFVDEANVRTESDVEFSEIRKKAIEALPPVDRWWWD